MNPNMATYNTPMGLILTGGGARAAYQVGVLQGLMEMRSPRDASAKNPFQIICGTSSGAINASVLACGADQFDETLQRLVQVWGQFEVGQVYRSEILDMLRSGLGWMSLLLLGWMIRHRRMRPRSLLDNTPLAGLLAEHIDFSRLPQIMAQGHVSALAITASSYSTGEHVTFYQSRHEARRTNAVRAHLHMHILAIRAIHNSLHGFGIFRAKIEDVTDFNASRGDTLSFRHGFISRRIMHFGCRRIFRRPFFKDALHGFAAVEIDIFSRRVELKEILVAKNFALTG